VALLEQAEPLAPLEQAELLEGQVLVVALQGAPVQEDPVQVVALPVVQAKLLLLLHLILQKAMSPIQSI
jgi:hypothetical protein